MTTLEQILPEYEEYIRTHGKRGAKSSVTRSKWKYCIKREFKIFGRANVEDITKEDLEQWKQIKEDLLFQQKISQ
ncbi:MAG: hypothetical protein IMZ63_01855, partial [Actinobacteria bacterium]|nr:hypothetical protein [Actinomycetota bacterium]